MIGILMQNNNCILKSESDCSEEQMEEIIKRHIELNKDLHNFEGCEIFTGDKAKEKLWLNDFNNLNEEYKWIINVTLEQQLNKYPYSQRKPVDKVLRIALKKFYNAGFGKTCSRCGGTGHYSYNMMYGTVCFKCNGNKFVLPKLTNKLKKEVEEHFQNK